VAYLISIDELIAALNDFVINTLQLAVAMDIAIESYDRSSLVLSAPLEKNINDKNTAFGGSLYVLNVMTCWGMVYMKCREGGIEMPNIVVSHAEIDYLAPVPDKEIIASCTINDEFDGFIEYYQANGRSRVKLQSSIVSEAKTAVLFKGKYAIIS
jgi:thioesterase domain-containing protein|tara:strand:+ start:52 stop:516 length:465 start_codon:yes stop_codon:yes gene_type:complete